VTSRRAAAWVEVVSTVVLSLAAVAIAWSGYQASRWTGEQAKAFSRANAARLESTRWSNLANSQTEIDVATFTQWVNSYARKETELADFYRKRFRKEFKPAVEAWIATRPLRNPGAPLTPFATSQYRLAANVEAERLQAKAGAEAAVRPGTSSAPPTTSWVWSCSRPRCSSAGSAPGSGIRGRVPWFSGWAVSCCSARWRGSRRSRSASRSSSHLPAAEALVGEGAASRWR
jgi:hypothetical protein